MTDLATILNQHAPDIAHTLLPSQKRAIFAIRHCRTATLGGHVFACPHCQERQYLFHSCRNRHCPRCQHDAGQQWLTRQADRLLPSRYFLLTFTLPSQLRSLAFTHQRQLYNLLFRAAAQATQQLALDPRHLGGQIGIIGVLHTWTRDLRYHPHVHFLVPAGALATDGSTWLPSRANFFLPVRALSRLFRGKFCAGLQSLALEADLDSLFAQEWVVHCKPVGNGLAALKYLAPYIFRVALTNNRILACRNGSVTFRFRRSDTGTWRTTRLPVNQFLQRFLRHVLPKGFVKVRYYGFFAPGQQHRFALARSLLSATPLTSPTRHAHKLAAPISPPRRQLCPHCHLPLARIAHLSPAARDPPASSS